MQLRNYLIGTAVILATLCLVYFPFTNTQSLSLKETYRADISFRKGISLLAQDSLAKAEKAFKDAIFCQPVYAPPHYYLAQAYARQRKFDEAVTEYQYAIKLDPESYPALYNLAVILGHLGEHAEAIALLKRATVLNPDYQVAYQKLARFYIETGDYKSAEEIYELLQKLKKAESE